MKTALEKLKELREKDSSIVAIAKDSSRIVCVFKNKIPEILNNNWVNGGMWEPIQYNSVDFGTDNWRECIVTYKDLQHFDIETITISKPEYDRLLACESKLNEIMKIFEK